MTEVLYKYLIGNKESTEKEIERLSKFRGLNTCGEQADINAFLEKYFSKDSVDNFEVTTFDHWNKWTKSFASNMLEGEHINPLSLEPFVARYVIAINKAGVKTYYSCDGWHKDSEHVLKIGFKERYSKIWHKIICSLLNDNNGVSWRYDGVLAILDLPKTDKGKIEKYKALNKKAEEIEVLQTKLIDIKKKLVSELKNKVKNNLSDEDIEKCMNAIVNQILAEDSK